MTKENNQNLIWLRYFGKKSNNPKRTVFMDRKAVTDLASELPYSLSIVFPNAT
jgi:hypothetical protein